MQPLVTVTPKGELLSRAINMFERNHRHKRHTNRAIETTGWY